MAVKLRMTRMGRRHRPFFRINAVESRTPRDGTILENLGHYDPIEKDPARQIVLNQQRVEYWLAKGAVPSDTVSQILLRQGIKHKYAEEKAARRARARAAARAKGRFFTKAEKIAADKAVEEKAAAEKAAAEKAKAEAEKPKAEPEPKEEPKEPEVKPVAEAKAPEKAGAEAEEPQAEAPEEKTGPEPEAKKKAAKKAEPKTKKETASTEETNASD